MGATVTETHWRKIHKRKNEHLLFAEDIGPPGSTVDVEIVDSGLTKVTSIDKPQGEELPWIGFRGKQKRLGLSRTNCKTIERLTGTPIVERWRGWITLVVVRTTITDRETKQRVETDAIRIAPRRPKQANHVTTEQQGGKDEQQGD